ncbi:polyamine oxidase 4 like protein [Verticillium longisporum]|uniref:Polyamine oxidase 4 like protein n=1 Tax=Verticillium longisporum TaxID=100787 RepID=A0A8I3AWL2_VERLO|nr:polyamine oxidase 4 like protein [Verticillium longisporum]
MSPPTDTPPAVQPHIGIIGAGVSGLRCADVLLSEGYHVTILEARGRIGGRICQSDDLGYTVDIGPNWIHAQTENSEPHAISRLAEETGTPMHSWNDKQLIFDSNGSAVPADTTERLSTLLWEIIEEAFNFSADAQKGTSTIDNDASLYDFIRDQAKEKLSDENERALLLKMSEMFGAYIGEPVWRQSLKFAWMEECCGGEELFVESNYSKILEKIAQPVESRARILLNTYVDSISSSEARGPGGKVHVGTKNGDSLAFDEVVITTPLGWLKRNQDAFTPRLPTRISSAIENISLSQLEKVFITFPSVFWNAKPELDDFPCYTNWLTPEYAEGSNPQHWPQEIWDLSTFRSPNNHPTILFYTYGDCARHIVNAISDMSREDEHSFLDEFFRPYYSRLPNYSPDNDNCRPKAILATKWLKDDLNGNASYCNFQVGVQEADEDVLTFRRGCPDRRLWFCGEHAAPFDECGTVAGAYLSGEAAGQRIIAKYA